MAPLSMFGQDPSKPTSSSAEGQTRPADVPLSAPTLSDLTELTAKFSTHGGGNVSPELSADLALEIILNEIVEQACLATGATGAAIALKRDGELVCRATSGTTAPELGARLDSETGLSGECIRTQQLQRCDDAQTDPRADVEASRLLGVHAVMVLPLLRNADLVGVFEVFSSRIGVFGERDERTVDALAQRVLRNLERAAEPLPPPPPVEAFAVPTNVLQSLQAGLQTIHDRDLSVRRGTDFITWALGIAVLTVAVLLGALLGQRFAWQRTAAGAHSARLVTAPPRLQTAQAKANANPVPGPAVGAAGKESGTSSTLPKPAAADGSLLVYENGKEVFRMPPGQPAQSSATTARQGEIQSASAIEPAHVELSSTAVEDSLLHRVEPAYPEAARTQQVEGPVVIDVHIGEDGGVQDLRLISGQPLLAQAALDAVKQWRFRPRLTNGHAVEMQTRITLNFRLPHG